MGVDQDDGGKTERYGKKYSWIAFYELAGAQEDRGALPDRAEGRISDCDIDPSFPEPPLSWKPHLASPFSRRFSSPITWLKSQIPSRRSVVHQKDIDEVEGPWTLLDGFTDEECSGEDPRRVFTFFRGLLVDPEKVEKLRSLVDASEYPGNSAIPDKGTDYYTFAGEIPWSSRYAPWLRRKDGTAKRCIGEAFSKYESYTVRRRVESLTPADGLSVVFPQHLRDDLLRLLGDDLEDPRQEESSDTGYATLTRHRHIPGVRVEVPAHSFGWEGYHSNMNKGGHPDFVAPAIAAELGLKNDGAHPDLFDAKGKLATLYRDVSDKDAYKSSHLLYLRSDLLETYLKKTNQVIVWIIWGEKGFRYPFFETYRDQVDKVWQDHGHIHKEFVGPS